MNVRQQLYKKFRLEGYSKYASARKAGYAHNTAIAAKQNIENRLKNFEHELEMAGLTDIALAQHAQDGLNANKVISAIIINQKNRPTSLADGELFEANEKTNDFIEVSDWSARHKYFETILKLMDKLKDKPIIDLSKHEHRTFIYLDKKAVEEANAGSNRIKSQLSAE